MDFAEELLEDAGVFDGLAGALALEGCHGVSGVANYADETVGTGVGAGGGMVPHAPDGEVRGAEELGG